MPPSSVSGTYSVSRRSGSGSYSTMAGLPSTVAGNGLQHPPPRHRSPPLLRR